MPRRKADPVEALLAIYYYELSDVQRGIVLYLVTDHQKRAGKCTEPVNLPRKPRAVEKPETAA